MLNSENSNPLIRRSWYYDEIPSFIETSDNDILASLVRGGHFPIVQAQRDAWLEQITLLRSALKGRKGRLYLEYTIPRMGNRVDAIILSRGIVFVVEFKIGATELLSADLDQAYDYAMDMKYFHEATHDLPVVPILVATEAEPRAFKLIPHGRVGDLYSPLCATVKTLPEVLLFVESSLKGMEVDYRVWENSRYSPTPTIIEAARALYANHDVSDISRSDASARNLRDTSEQIIKIIESSRAKHRKSICFVTGVPGAGKTLVGLSMATQYSDPKNELHSVFLSGNAPLVAILREALARNTIKREREKGEKVKKGDAKARVKSFIQNVHHFRDECLADSERPPFDHVVIFDEAQRAWNLERTSAFMQRKKGVPNFRESEPEYLISCMDRRTDWATIICLVGGGQEINRGEAGIAEWIHSLNRSFSHWDIHISPALTDSEYGAGEILSTLKNRSNVLYDDALHLSVSVRSFRSEKVSSFVKRLLDIEPEEAGGIFKDFSSRYPIVLTRNLDQARQWLRDQAHGSERYGIVVSSQAERLKPYAVDVRSPMDPVKWFLDGKDDVRSSYYLEEVATEFHVQGLELDWTCVCWDGDFRHSADGWQNYSFGGSKWRHIRKPELRTYQKNAYRVLLTRARQGMVVCVPEGSLTDPTRDPSYYDSTYSYLRGIGLPVLD